MKKIDENIYRIEKIDIKEIFKERKNDTNKGDYGYVGILGGCLEYSGAIKLANMSCSSLRAGCGVVRVIVPRRISKYLCPHILEQTIYPLNDNDEGMLFNSKEIDEALQKLKAIAIGMGWRQGKENEKILKYILERYDIPVLIDADGLNILAKMDLELLNKTKCKVVLTPHLKEFERLTNINIDEIKKDPIKISKNFAKRYNINLLLKGPTTYITNGEEIYLVNKGCPGMATAGSGDVLSGILIGLLGYNEPNILTISAGAYLAGLAGELAQNKYTDISMKASDTIKFIPDAIKNIRNEK